MSDDRQARILAALRELFDAIAEEVRANPSFAGKVRRPSPMGVQQGARSESGARSTFRSRHRA